MASAWARPATESDALWLHLGDTILRRDRGGDSRLCRGLGRHDAVLHVGNSKFNPEAAWDERERVYEMSSLIVQSQSITAWRKAYAAALDMRRRRGGVPVRAAGAGRAVTAATRRPARRPPSFLGIAGRGLRCAPIVIAASRSISAPPTERRALRARARSPASEPDADVWRASESFVRSRNAPLADIDNFADLALGDLAAGLKLIETQARGLEHLVALGGDHGHHAAAAARLKTRRGPPALIDFDAHVDTWPENFGQTYAHGTVFFTPSRRAWYNRSGWTIGSGIRSTLPRTVHDWTAERGVTMIPAQEVHEGAGTADIAQRIHEIVGEQEVDLSFDIDHSIRHSRGHGTPEVGGSRAGRRRRSCDGLAG